jgi:hypothetical protein
MSENDAATPIREVIDRYISVWNEPDADARRHAIAELWAEGGTYTDPLAAAEGWRQIEDVISGARGQFPGHVFDLIGVVDAHHDIARFSWELVPEGGGESVVVGFDVAVVTDEGRLSNVLGFLDKVPAA